MITTENPIIPIPVFPYDADDDMRASIEWAYRHIRERVAQGGPGWGGWPEK